MVPDASYVVQSVLVLAERHATDVVKVMQGQAGAMKTVPSRLKHQRELSHAEPL